jgi:hypothetical protein
VGSGSATPAVLREKPFIDSAEAKGIASMAKSRLRIYYGPQQANTRVRRSAEPENTVRVPLGEIFPLLADAVHSQRTWLQDFEHDEITISADLYEVILAYQHIRRPSAS